MNKFRCIGLSALCLLGGCDVVDRPYYKLSAPDGTVVRETAAVSQLQIPIGQEIELGFTVLCYALAPPRDFSAGDSCEIGVYASSAEEIQFTSMDFSAEAVDPPGMEMAAEARIPDFLSASAARNSSRPFRETVIVDLSYDDAPQQFLLHLPALATENTVYEPPSVTFTYQDNIDIDPVLSFW